MADGDDREENADNKQPDESIFPDLENLHVADLEDPEGIEKEYRALDSQLNQLDACLDSLEARNDDLMAKLKAFLQDGTLTSQTPPSDDAQPGDDRGSGAGQEDTATSSDGKSKAGASVDGS